MRVLLPIAVISALAAFFAFCQSGKAESSCSYNDGRQIPASVVIDNGDIQILWSDGPRTSLRMIAARKYVDAYGGIWFKMSNTNFLGLWRDQGGKTNRIVCF